MSLAEAVDHHDNNNDGNKHDSNNCRDDGDQNSHEVVALICEIKKGGEKGGEKGGGGEEREGRGKRGSERKEKGRKGEGKGGKADRMNGGRRVKIDGRERNERRKEGGMKVLLNSTFSLANTLSNKQSKMNYTT